MVIPVGRCLAGTVPCDIAMITWRDQTPAEQGFKDHLAKYGINAIYHSYNAEQDPRKLDRIIATIKKESWDLIYLFGTTVTRAVLAEINNQPVVFNVVTRPVETGIIKSWNRSGNNSTGVSSKVPILNQLKALKKVLDYHTLAMVFNPMEPNSLIQRDIVKALAKKMKFTLKEFHITQPGDLDQVLPGIKGTADAVYFPSDSRINSIGNRIMEIINRMEIPSLSAMESMVIQDNALMGLVPDYYDLGSLAASKAIRILQGESPGDIPCSTLNYFRISINMKTARQIGIQIPTSLLIISDTIIR